MNRKHIARIALAAVAVSALAAGCGDDDDNGGSTPAGSDAGTDAGSATIATVADGGSATTAG